LNYFKYDKNNNCLNNFNFGVRILFYCIRNSIASKSEKEPEQAKASRFSAALLAGIVIFIWKKLKKSKRCTQHKAELKKLYPKNTLKVGQAG